MRHYEGGITTTQKRVKRPNGDIYVYERQITYDREKHRTVTVKCRLLGKILPGTTEMVATRSRRKSAPENATAAGE